MEAAFCIEFCDEIRASDAGTSRTDGVLHAGASSAASELILLDHPVLAVLSLIASAILGLARPTITGVSGGVRRGDGEKKDAPTGTRTRVLSLEG